MEQEPLKEGQRTLSAMKRPHGAILLLVLALPILVATAGLSAWLAMFTETSIFGLSIPYAIGIVGLLQTVLMFFMMMTILIPYERYIKNTNTTIEQVAKKGEHYVQAMIGSSLGFWDYAPQTRMLFFSSHMMSLLGYPEADRVTDIDFWYQHIHPEDLEGVKRTMAAHLDHRTPEYWIEYRIRRTNDEYVWVADRGRATLDGAGKSIRLSGITEDITNVKRVQEVLESRTNELQEATGAIEREIQNVRKFQKAVDASTEAVSITTPDGAIIYVNPAWTILNGYTVSEAVGRNHRMLKNSQTKQEVFIAMWEKISSGVSFVSEEIVNTRKDQTVYQADLSIFPIRENNQNLFYVSISQDITQRKEIDRAKTEFVSLASHQLRTPLSAIRWYSEMLLSKYVGELNDKQRQYVKEIYAGNLRMVELVNALLNVSRIDLGTFAVEPEPVNLVEICESVIMELTPQINEKQQTVERIFASAPQTYSADQKLIRIVFQNFLSNSVKYTQPGGHVVAEISTREGSVYIRVSDNGYGIPKAQHGKIFEKLFRADNVRQKDTEGTGLGMYIVKAIVESSGGSIWFESEENQGTTFHVLMPLTGMTKKSGFKGLT